MDLDSNSTCSWQSQPDHCWLLVQMASRNLGSVQSALPHHQAYIFGWDLLTFLMLFISICSISRYEKNGPLNITSAYRAEEFSEDTKRPGLKKLLIVSGTTVVVIMNRFGKQNDYPVPFFLATLLPTVWLLFYTADKDICCYIHRILSTKLDCHRDKRPSRVAPMD
jgi:hypothetical protein